MKNTIALKNTIACFAIAIACHVTGAAADEGVPGPERDGVRMRLVPLAEKFQVGKPMPFRLEMKNVSEQVVNYDSQQVGVNAPLLVKDADGKEVAYVGGSVQTSGGAMPLKPGAVEVLERSIDVGRDYLITEEGSYRVQFRAQGAAFGTVRFPESNAVEVKVAKGEVSEIQAVAVKLSAALPDDRWELSFVDKVLDLVCNRTGLKADLYVISLLLESEKLEGDRADEYALGSGGGRFVYMSEFPGGAEIEEIWKGHRKVIAAAFGVGEG